MNVAILVSDTDENLARLRVVAELAGLMHSHDSILGLVYLRDNPNDHPDFLAEAKKLGELLEMELIKVGNEYHPDHVFTTGFQVLELAAQLDVMNEDSDEDILLNGDGPYPDFNIDIIKLTDQYETEFAEFAKQTFGEANVKTETDLTERYAEFRQLSYDIDGVALPVEDDEPDSDTIEAQLTEDAVSTVDADLGASAAKTVEAEEAEMA